MSKALPRLPVTFDWTGVKTDSDDRKLQSGELTSLVNYRRTVNGRLQKRLGNDRFALSTFSGGTYAGPTIDIVPADGLIIRDTSNQIFAHDTSDGKMYFRGTDPRCHPTWTRLENSTQGLVYKPVVVQSGTNLFHFVGITSYLAFDNRIQCTVFSAVDGTVRKQPFMLAGDSNNVISATVDATGDVWVAWLSGDSFHASEISIKKISGTTLAETLTNTITVASHKFQDVQLRKLETNEVAIAAVSVDTSGANIVTKHYHAYLDLTNGAAKVSPAAVSTTYTGATVAGNPRTGNGISIAANDSGDAFFYYSFWRAKDATTLQLTRIKVTASTLAISTTVELDTQAASGADNWIGSSGGFVAAGSAETWFGSVHHLHATNGPDQMRTSIVRKVTFSGSATATTLARSAYLAGQPFKIGSTYHILTGHDDMTSVTSPGTQRGYFVRDISGRIMATILDGLGGQVFFNGGIGSHGDYSLHLQCAHTVVPVVSGTKAYIPCLQAGAAAPIFELMLATVDFAPVWDSKVAGIVPGGIPKFVSRKDQLTELAPIHYPYVDLAIQDDGTEPTVHSTTLATYLYCTIASDGSIIRSAPATTDTLIFNEHGPNTFYTVRLPTLRHTIGATWIEYYMSENQDTSDDVNLYLAKRVLNDPTVDAVDIYIQPSLFTAGDGELIYTTNLAAAFENASLPPARLVVRWRDRLWLGGTPEDDLWFSQERAAGVADGYEFNEGLTTSWADGDGPITALLPLDWNALVVFRGNAVGLITGEGPDPGGGGAPYIVQTISYEKGCSSPKAVTRGPLGVYFIDASTGRPNVISGGVISEISQGYEAYTGLTLVAAAHDEAQKVVRFYASNGKVLKLDYRHPFGEQVAGQWMEDSN